MRVWLFVFKAQRIAGHQVGVPFRERAVVNQLVDSLAGRDIKVIVTFVANVVSLFDFFFEDRFFATWTLNPNAFGDATFFSSHNFFGRGVSGG